MSAAGIRPYWLELMKDVLYRKPSVGPQTVLFRTVENVSMHTPPEAWESMPFSLGDLGYSGSGSVKQRQWKSYYWPPEPEWNLFREKIEALRGRCTYYASIALPLRGTETKEGSIKGTKGNCLLNLVVNITRGRKEASYKVWVISRYAEIVQKLGADLYFVHGLLLPRVRSIVEDVMPDAQFRGVDFYFTAAYLVYYKILGLALVTDAPDVVLREAVDNAIRSSNQFEIEFLKTATRNIIESIEGTVRRFKYRSRAKLGVLYGPLWLPHADSVREIWGRLSSNVNSENAGR